MTVLMFIQPTTKTLIFIRTIYSKTWMIHHVAIGDNFDNIIKSVQETQPITHVL